MSAPQSINSPEQFVIRALLLWSLALIATGTVYAFLGDTWAYVVIVLGVLTAFAAWWGHKKGNWCQALYSALFLVGLALIVAGPMAREDQYIVAGVLTLIVLCVGATLTHLLGQILRQLETRGN